MTHTPTPSKPTDEEFDRAALWASRGRLVPTMADAAIADANKLLTANRLKNYSAVCRERDELVAALTNMRKALALTGDLTSIGMAADNDAALALAKARL